MHSLDVEVRDDLDVVLVVKDYLVVLVDVLGSFSDR